MAIITIDSFHNLFFFFLPGGACLCIHTHTHQLAESCYAIVVACFYFLNRRWEPGNPFVGILSFVCHCSDGRKEWRLVITISIASLKQYSFPFFSMKRAMPTGDLGWHAIPRPLMATTPRTISIRDSNSGFFPFPSEMSLKAQQYWLISFGLLWNFSCCRDNVSLS